MPDEDSEPVVEIKARHNGPYRVEGPIRLIDADGNEYDLSEQGQVIALCRCGGSTTKPFCDGTHSKKGFEAAERAVRAEEQSR
ncbi:MAG TPA: CDGSH iron-sulfur domain-containing protein [Thermoleophilaceae bacterium]|nr:CDGSH iron-sulfur domain-containing protein [Thermoleophilaceae bacterium]